MASRSFSLALAFALFTIATTSAQAPNRAAVEAQAKRAAERIRVLQREADSLAATARTLLADLRKLELDRQIRAEEVAKAQADLELATAELATTESEVSRLNAAIERQRPVIASRLADVYRLGRPGYWRLLLDVDDLQSVGRAYRTMSAIAQLDRSRVDEYRSTLKALADTQETLAARAETAKQTRATAQSARAALDRAVTAQGRAPPRDRRAPRSQRAADGRTAGRGTEASGVGDRTRDAELGPDAALPLAPFRGDLPWPAAGAGALRLR